MLFRVRQKIQKTFTTNDREFIKQWLEIKKKSLEKIVDGFVVFSISITAYITSILLSFCIPH